MSLPLLTIFLLTQFASSQALNSQVARYLLSETFEGTWKLFETSQSERIVPWNEVQETEGRALIYFTK